MRKLAIIENGLVENIIVIPDGKEGEKEIQARSGVEVTDPNVKIGWSYDGENFIEPDPTPEQLEARAKAEEKQAKLESAKRKLAALGLSPEEIAAITGA